MGDKAGLNHLLDDEYSLDGLNALLMAGADVSRIDPLTGEAPIHVAARRRRLEAVQRLLDAGAEIDVHNSNGKTAWAHCVRRGFDEIAEVLAQRGADTSLPPADAFAVALIHQDLDRARQILDAHPGVQRTGNPEEDRLLADLAGRLATRPVAFLIEVGADLVAPALDDGTPLHQAAWFGSPQNARLLVEAGAPLDSWDSVHHMTPLGWAVHGSRYSGDAEIRQDAYVAIVRLLLGAGATLEHPESYPPASNYLTRLRRDASPAVLELLPDIGD